MCPEDIEFVCGSNHKTYQNECFMKKESCQQQQLIKIRHIGVCSKSKSFLKEFFTKIMKVSAVLKVTFQRQNTFFV